MKTVKISDIRIDGDTQSRSFIDTIVVQDYKEAIEAGKEFPPIELCFDGKHYWLVDGFHRYFAHRDAGKFEIKASISNGTKLDAQWLSLAANKSNGMYRSNDDKKNAVIKALKMRGDTYSNYDIAAHVGVNEITVRRHKKDLEDDATKSHVKMTTCIGTNGIDYSEANKKREAKRNRIDPPQQEEETKHTHLQPPTFPVSEPEVELSPQAYVPVKGHSEPEQRRTVNLSDKYPEMAAATIYEYFKEDWITTFIKELNKLRNQ